MVGMGKGERVYGGSMGYVTGEGIARVDNSLRLSLHTLVCVGMGGGGRATVKGSGAAMGAAALCQAARSPLPPNLPPPAMSLPA